MNEVKVQKNETIQLVRFTVGSEEYGVPIEDVQEIVRTPNITPLPNTENFVKGIIYIVLDFIADIVRFIKSI